MSLELHMTRHATENLIESLSRNLSPVRPLRPPLRRALLWLFAVALLAGVALWRWSNLELFMARNDDPRLMWERTATLLTGISAIVAAFYLSLPDRSRLWGYMAIPPLLVWIACAGLGCLKAGVGWGPPGDHMGETVRCFRFIVIVSVPLALLLYLVLRRARPLQPLPVALSAALGVAALAAFILQFFHPFDSTAIDLAMHFGAVLTIIAAAAAARRVLT